MKSDWYFDLQGLSRLRDLTRADSARALDVVSRQFEALFLQMLLKGMRKGSMGDPLLGSKQLDFFRGMYDQQLAVGLASRGGLGIADLLVEQLRGKKVPTEKEQNGTYRVPPRSGLPAVMPRSDEGNMAVSANSPVGPPRFDSPEVFVRHLWPYAREAARELGVSPELLLAQAALETGWGKKIIQRKSAGSSHNLFNIKADHRWPGERVVVETLEYIGGRMVRQRAAFRAYGGYGESFSDYVAFLKGNPRYHEALQQRGNDRAFIAALQHAGYATDPGYAKKIIEILRGRRMAEAVDAVKFASG